jgi:hypothetical protein
VVGWSRCAAIVALAYAGGFIILAAPGGLGVRDFLIQHFLIIDLALVLDESAAAATAALAAVVIRLLWTIADVSAATAAYFIRRGVPKPGEFD